VIVFVATALGCVEEPVQVPESPSEHLAYEKSRGPGVSVTGAALSGAPDELDRDRSVTATLEIDRANPLPELSFATLTRKGPIDLISILGEVGITLEIVWSDRLAPGELLDEPWPGEERLRELMARYRNVQVPDDQWHFYILLGKKTQAEQELSLVIDPEHRTGAVVFVDPEDAAGTLHAVGHEIGHLLNLPHPWEVYGNTRSLMSYPWRWEDWEWDDPEIFRFDAAGRRHVLRSPDRMVRPGMGGRVGPAD
jgi:hypothetical protein